MHSKMMRGSYRHHHSLHFWHAASAHIKAVSLLLALFSISVVVIIVLGSHGGLNTLTIKPAELGRFTLYTLSRMLFAYLIALVLAITLASLTMLSRRVESVLIPLFDVLGSVPALAFFPIAVVAFATINLNLAAVFILLTAMIWPLVFGMISAIHLIPQEVKYAARMFGASRGKFIREIVLPASFPALVTGTILAWGQGWNIIIISEWINFNGHIIVLPGLGSLLDKGAYGFNGAPPSTATFLLALVTLIAVIIVINTLIWQRLLKHAERYKFDA
jgi:NitT/TauT family transport system permease protein